MPAAPQIDVPVEMRGEDVVLKFGDREYRVRGLKKNTKRRGVGVNLRVMGVNFHGDVALHVETLELNASRQRMAFIKQAAEELGIKEEIVRHDVGKVLEVGGGAGRAACRGARAEGAGNQTNR